MPKEKNTVQRNLLACVEERFHGFELVKILTEISIRQNYKPIDIVYKPVLKINQIINCFFTTSMRNSYRVVSGNKNVSTTAGQCFGYNKFFIKRKSLKRHMDVSSHFPGIIYKFENQNMKFDNMKSIGDLPFLIYFDLETTTNKNI